MHRVHGKHNILNGWKKQKQWWHCTYWRCCILLEPILIAMQLEHRHDCWERSWSKWKILKDYNPEIMFEMYITKIRLLVFLTWNYKVAKIIEIYVACHPNWLSVNCYPKVYWKQGYQLLGLLNDNQRDIVLSCDKYTPEAGPEWSRWTEVLTPFAGLHHNLGWINVHAALLLSR